MGATPKNFKTTGKDEGPPPLNSMECGFFFGGIGLGIYFGSFVDFVISMVIGLITFAVAGSAMEEMGLISGGLIAAAYGYFRTESSNAKLADSSVAIVREQTYTGIR